MRVFIVFMGVTAATVVDMEPIFKAHFEKSVLSLDLAPQDAVESGAAVGVEDDALPSGEPRREGTNQRPQQEVRSARQRQRQQEPTRSFS